MLTSQSGYSLPCCLWISQVRRHGRRHLATIPGESCLRRFMPGCVRSYISTAAVKLTHLVTASSPPSTGRRERCAVPVPSAIRYARSILKYGAAFILVNASWQATTLLESQCIPARASPPSLLRAKAAFCAKEPSAMLKAGPLLESSSRFYTNSQPACPPQKSVIVGGYFPVPQGRDCAIFGNRPPQTRLSMPASGPSAASARRLFRGRLPF